MNDMALPWRALSLPEVRALLDDAPFTWWVAGGWAIDLFLGRTTRPHGDVDLALPRTDALKLQLRLAGWRQYAVDPPGAVRPWKPGEVLLPPIRDLWCSRHADCWEMQLMLEDVTDGIWTYRRDPRIKLPVAEILETNAEGLRYLRPEIELLFKARDLRPKDEADFTAVLPALDRGRRDRLRDMLVLGYPDGHRWLAPLD
jgi:hypothetical protein